MEDPQRRRARARRALRLGTTRTGRSAACNHALNAGNAGALGVSFTPDIGSTIAFMVDGSGQNDLLSGGTIGDVLDGGAGGDTMSGGFGNDTSAVCWAATR